MMGIFDGIEKATRQYDNNFLRAGRYVLRIERVSSGNSRKGDFWKFEATVLAVLNDEAGQGHRAGEVVTRLRPQSQDGALPEFKSLICCVLECKDEEITAQDCYAVTDDNQPLAGMVIEVHARQVETKKSTPERPAVFTRVDYRRRVDLKELPALLGSDLSKFYPSGLPAFK